MNSQSLETRYSNQLLKAAEIAKILNVSKAFVYKLMRKGEIPVVKILGTNRVRKMDLERFIAKNLTN